MLYLLQLLIQLKYSNVKPLKIHELARWLDEETLPTPLIIDTRTHEEYTVSHIKNAQMIEPDNPDLARLDEVALNTPVVVYCSVGYRSAKVAQQLQDLGFENVFNLNGGIFEWVNQGNPVFQDRYQVEIVHPYNLIWGKLLKSRYRA